MKFLALTLLALVFSSTSFAAKAANTSVLPEDNCIMVTKWSKEFADKVGDNLLSNEEKATSPAMGSRVLIVSKKVLKQMVNDMGISLKTTVATGIAFFVIHGQAAEAMIEHLIKTVNITLDSSKRILDSALLLGRDAIRDASVILGNWLKIQGLYLQIAGLKAWEFATSVTAKAIVTAGVAIASVSGVLYRFAYNASQTLSKVIITINEVFLVLNLALASAIVRVDQYINEFVQKAVVAVADGTVNILEAIRATEGELADKVINVQGLRIAVLETMKADAAKKLGEGWKKAFAMVPECATISCIPVNN